jgi:hypothetical protein
MGDVRFTNRSTYSDDIDCKEVRGLPWDIMFYELSL